jgi:hypothetical protein
MSLRTSDLQPQPPPAKQSCACTHSRLISDNVTEEEHKAGKVRCVECGAIVPDPYLKQDGKKT